MISGERFISKLMKRVGVMGLTTIDFTGIDLNYIEFQGGAGRRDIKDNVLTIRDSFWTTVRDRGFGKWRTVKDNSIARNPHASVTDENKKKIGGGLRDIRRGKPKKIDVLGGAILVYHGPGNKVIYPTR